MASDEITCKFEHSGKIHEAQLSFIPGAGYHHYYAVSVDGKSKGTLLKTEHFGWQFRTTKGSFPEFAEMFGKAVEDHLKTKEADSK